MKKEFIGFFPNDIHALCEDARWELSGELFIKVASTSISHRRSVSEVETAALGKDI